MSTYRKHSRTACNRPYTRVAKHIPGTALRSCRPECDNTSRQGRVQCCRDTLYDYFVLFSSSLFERAFLEPPTVIFVFFPSTGDTQPCDGPPSRLYQVLFLDWNVGVTDVTKNSRLCAVTSTTRSTLLLLAVCVCFFHPSTSSTQESVPICYPRDKKLFCRSL